MPNETFRDVHIDRPLTNFSVALFQDTTDFVSHRFFPRVPVVHASDLYDYYPSGYFNRIHESKRAEEGIANTIGYKVKQKSYQIGDDALRTFISDKKRANADNPMNLDRDGTALVTRALLLAGEQEFADRFLIPGVWTTDLTGVTGTPGPNQFVQWDDAASTPVEDVGKIRLRMMLAGKRKPNKGLMTLDVYEVLKNHPDVLERIKYTGTMDDPARVQQRAIMALFELEELLIMQTVVNTAIEGIEDADGNPPTTDTFMKEGVFLLGYAPRVATLMSPVAGVTFMQTNYIPMGVDGGPSVRRYRETPAKKGEYIEAEYAKDQRVVAPDLGALMTNVVSKQTP